MEYLFDAHTYIASLYKVLTFWHKKSGKVLPIPLVCLLSKGC